MGAADDGEAEGALRFGLDGLARAGAGGAAGLRLLRPDLPELLCVGEDEVHMLGPGCQHGGLSLQISDGTAVPCRTQASDPSSASHR